MKVHDISIYDIKDYENNPRRISEEAVNVVASSIREFGFKQPIVIDKNNVIVCGHTRVRAAKKLGIEEIPCIIADDLTPEQIKAFRLADNKTSELSAWDFDKLDLELEELNLDFDMVEFGFADSNEVDLDDFFTEAEQDSETGYGKTQQIQCPHCGQWFVK